MADNANKEIKTATADDGSTGYEMKIGLGTIAMLISATGMGLVPLFSRWATRTDMFDGALGLNAGDSIGALMAVGRMSMGVLFFVVIMFATGKVETFKKLKLTPAIALGGLMIGMSLACYVTSTLLTTISNAVLFIYIGPVVCVVLARIFRKEPMSALQWVCLVAVFIGMLFGNNLMGFNESGFFVDFNLVPSTPEFPQKGLGDAFGLASGEYAGAATFLAEYAPSDKRGVYCSLVPASTAVGLLVGSTFATVMYTILPDAAVNEWGWRIPFLLAGPLGLVAHYIRTKLEDSPTYQEMQAAISKTDDSNHPIRDLFRHHTKELIISFGAAMLNAVGFYVVLTYLPVYLETVVMMPANESSLITTICLVAYVAFIFGMGHLSDKFGRKKMLIIACVSFIVLTVPAFMLLNTAQFFTVLAVELVLCLALTINDGTLSSYLTETFPTAVRYTGFALSFNLANALFGGSASFISTALIAATGSGLAPAWYMVGVSCVALVAMILSHEHTGKDLSEV